MKTLLAALTLIAAFASPQQNAAKPLYVVSYIDVFPAYAMEAATLLQTFATDSRKDPGSVRFEVFRDVARVNHFSIVEIWDSQKSYDAHLAHTRTFREKLQAGLGSPFDERLYNNLQ
jgi:quinol monooxygenase YgiN